MTAGNQDSKEIDHRAAGCLRQAAAAYESGELRPYKGDFYDMPNDSGAPMACALGALVMCAASKTPSYVKRRLKNPIRHDTLFDNLENSITGDQRQILDRADQALRESKDFQAQLKTYLNSQEVIVNVNSINDYLMPDGAEGISETVRWFRDAADWLERAGNGEPGDSSPRRQTKNAGAALSVEPICRTAAEPKE